MTLWDACKRIEGWDTLDVYALQDMLLESTRTAEQQGVRLDEIIDITDLPTAYSRELNQVRGTVVWACDIKRQCLHGPQFEVSLLDDLLENDQDRSME